ncbi:sodium/hydrogen exchanger family protein [Nonomuraea polychroma]|uniref:Sodium/hydrogen exchanger family protein n=1 Tax=Nonomuraea polychroma TaxID=46176 RepID=A0A438MBC5_9ACTN|nr:cation:proton antiporter [Nonomuraea polychroma]RVX42987.1 sodium/hydrogen exchanger family protein [Nonomuraea polychroma]
MARVWLLILVLLAGWGTARLTGIADLETSETYLLASQLLLAIGLYGSTHDIDRAVARAHARLIVAAVTVGVVLKAALIASVLYLFTGDPLAVVLAVAVAQIDPLSVASVMGDSRLSPKARTILAAWASFDDPVTVVLSVYAATLAFSSDGISVSHLADLGWNALFAAVAYAVWRLVRRGPAWLINTAAVAAVLVGAWTFLMLAVAIIGLFLRLPDGRRLAQAVAVAFPLAAFLMGMLLVNGMAPAEGMLLGAVAFCAQVLAAAALTWGLPVIDRVRLALAQQNGVTAVILALVFERSLDGFVAVVAPAVVTVNLLHALANRAADTWERRRSSVP